METVTVASLMTSIGSVFTAAIGWVGDVGVAVAAGPILLLAVVGLPMCGLGIGMFKRLMSSRA